MSGAIKRKIGSKTVALFYHDGVVIQQDDGLKERMMFLRHAEVTKLSNLDKKLKGLV